MNKGTIILTGFFFITGCLFYIASCFDEPVIQRDIKRDIVKEIVHDTIVKYRTHECSKEYGVDADQIDGKTYVFEIHSKKTDEIVFFLQPFVIWNQITKAGGKTTIAESDMCRHWKDQHTIGCYVEATVNGNSISFYKEWPDTEFYIVETYSIGLSPAVNTVNYIPSPK